ELQGRTDRRDPGGSVDQDLQAGPVVRPLPRTAYALDQGYRDRVQADQGGRCLLARRQQQSGAVTSLWNGVRQSEGTRRLSEDGRRGREARPPQAGPGARSVPSAG